MRADRLIALLLFLQSRGRVTAAEAAQELEVSLATARRDLEALSAAGIPIYVQPGRGGGWQLLGDARTNLSGLTGHESRALFWMLGTAGLSGPETRVATRKLLRALPRSLREEAERLASSIHYDHEAWGESRGETSEDLDLLRDAVVQRRRIRTSYSSRSGRRTNLELEPLGLVAKAGVWYLVAGGAAGPRTYRAARLALLVTTDETFAPPDDFDLTEFWRAHVEEVEQLRSGVAATLRVEEWVVPILQQQFGRYCTVLARDGELVRIEVRAHLIVGLAEQLAGWGDRIDVVSPPRLRDELRRIGTELLSHPGGAGDDRVG